MAMKVLAVVMTCFAVLQDPAADIERAILQLSNDDPQVRAKAESVLRAFGPKAIPALREASQTVGALTRESAKRILAEIERIEFEGPMDAENRKKIFVKDKSREDSAWRNLYPLSME